MKKIITGIVRRFAFDIVRCRSSPESVRADVRLDDLTPREIQIIQSVKPYTLTNEERMATLVSASEKPLTKMSPSTI